MNIRSTVAVACALLTATLASAEPFTYQGRLDDNSAPADGEYDLVFRLYDAAVGGSQIGSADVHENTLVTEGIFTLELDFGDDLFQTGPRYIEVRVRPGDSGGSFDTLAPRTLINPAPVAQYAFDAQHAMVADALTSPIWNESGSTVYTGDGATRVFINRTSPITSAEFFGVHVESTGFGGMYISGPADSFPFYGYSVDGAVSAYTYFNPNDDSLNFVGAGLVTSLRITAGNNVEVANDIQAESYQFETPKLHYLSVSGNTFVCGSGDDFIASAGTGGAYISNAGTSGWLVAPVNLPDGATISRLRGYITDTAAGDISITLYRAQHGFGAASNLARIETVGTPGGIIQLIDGTVSGATVSNSSFHYYLRVYSANWPGNNTLRVDSVIIEYTVSEAD